jgi:hypothetical protein
MNSCRCFEPIESFLALSKTVVHMMLSNVCYHLGSWSACCVVKQSFGHHFKCIKLHSHPQDTAAITYLSSVTVFLDTCCVIFLCLNRLLIVLIFSITYLHTLALRGLSKSMCYFIYKFHIPTKWQIFKNNESASHFALIFFFWGGGGGAMDTFKNGKVA